MSKPKRPDKWDKKSENLWERLENDIRTDAPKIAAALRRTDAAAYRRGLSTVLLKRIEAMQKEPRKGAIQ